MTRDILILATMSAIGCSAHRGHVGNSTGGSEDTEQRRIENLERAAQYPWIDNGVCAVREASSNWKTLVEKCYQALDLSRIRFKEQDHRCSAATLQVAAVGQLIGICILAQPQIAVGAVIVIGAVVVAAAIAAELQKCRCMCVSIDNLGKRHGPYENGKTKSKFVCEQDCLQKGYTGGGFCK